MSGAAAIGGNFWPIEDPEVRARGVFTAEVGKKPEVTLAAPVVAHPPPTAPTEPGDLPAALAAYAVSRVEAFQPITLQGQLDNGDLVTLLTARSQERTGRHHYIGDVAVLGTVVGDDQLYRCVRFRVDHPFWLDHLTDGESSIVEDDRSTLTVEASENGNWLVYESTVPATLRQLEIRVTSGCLALVYLVLRPEEDIAVCATHVRVDPDSPWLSVHGPAFDAELPETLHLLTLLPRSELTVKRFAEWVALNDPFEGLAWAVARPPEGVLQVQAQVLTSVVEGLHRRLPYKKKRFPDVDKAALGRILDTAREAAGGQAEIEELDREHVMQAITILSEVSFKDRAKDVVTDVFGAVPEIVESVPDLPKLLMNARVNFAHQLRDKKKESLENRIRQWIVVIRVTPWLLRVLLLLQAGVEPRVLHDKYLEDDRFQFFRANTAQLARELGWELPSSIECRYCAERQKP